MSVVSYSLHPTRGKPTQPHIIRQLGHGWMNVTTTLEEFWELVTVDGHATSSCLTSDHRHSDNFESRQIFMIDIDSGMTVDELLVNPTYNELAYGFYVTPSHTSDAHRFRIVFVAEEPVANQEHALRVFQQLTQLFPQCDSVCRDATRIFYGTPNCEIKEILGGKLSKETVDFIIARMEPPPPPPVEVARSSDRLTRIPRKITELIEDMRPGDRSAKACKIGGIAQYLTPELKQEVELKLVQAGCDRTAIKSFRKYSRDK